MEARSSIGTAGRVAKRDWYFWADVSGRWHSDGCQRQKLDLVFGFSGGKNVTYSPQIYFEQSNRAADSIAFQTEWIQHFPKFDLTFAVKNENGDEFEQQALLVAISKRF